MINWFKKLKPCECSKYKVYAHVKNSKYFKILDKDSYFIRTEGIVSQCNKCNRIYLWKWCYDLTLEAHIFDKVLHKYQASREPLEKMREDVICAIKESGCKTYWEYSDIKEIE